MTNVIYRSENGFDNAMVTKLMGFPLLPEDFREMSNEFFLANEAAGPSRGTMKRFFSDVAAAAIDAEITSGVVDTNILGLNLPEMTIGYGERSKTLKSSFDQLPHLAHFIVQMVDMFTQDILMPADAKKLLGNDSAKHIRIFVDVLDAVLYDYPATWTDLIDMDFMDYYVQVLGPIDATV